MREFGFSLTEALLGVLLFLVLSGAVFALVLPDVRLAQAAPPAADLQQRGRVAAAALEADLRRAGAGLDSGPLAGSFGRRFAVLLPRRLGPGSPDGPRTARADAISIIAAAGPTHTSLASPLDAGGVLRVTTGGSCPAALPLCGFVPGDLVLVVADDGGYVVVEVESVGPDQAIVAAWQGSLDRAFAAGSVAALADIRTYAFSPMTGELRQTVQDSSTVPLVDAVADVRFAFSGDPSPPAWPRPPLGTANCLYDAAGTPVALPLLGGDPSGLVDLPISLFGDGPWCGTGAFEYDADLLRVRRVVATVRLAPSLAAHRLTESRHALTGVADMAFSVGVAPPNLGTVR